jgi:protein Tex
VPFVARYRKEATAALEGARAVLVERFTEDATLIGTLREEVWSRGRLCSRVRAGKAEPGAKFADYFEFSEPLAKLPSHRILALFRGEKEEVLILELVPDPAAPDRGEPGAFWANRFKIADHGRPGDRWLIDTVRLAWRTRILVHIEIDLRLRLWQAAEDTAVQVFAGNLRDLLLAAPAGARRDGLVRPFRHFPFREGPRVRIPLPPPARWYGAGGEEMAPSSL